MWAANGWALVQLCLFTGVGHFTQMLLHQPPPFRNKKFRNKNATATLKRLFSGLTIAALACAQAQAAPHTRADFRGETASSEVRRMADWVVVSADNGSLPFVIVDKKNAEVFVFDRQGQVLGAAPALLGLAVGDDSVPGVGDKPLSAIPPKDRTTPAGRFVGYMDQHPGKPNFLWVDYKDNVSLHRVVKGRPQDQRAERLASPTTADNRISFGCINVPADFFDHAVLPTFKGSRGVVYVMPEVRATRDFFPKYYDVVE